VAEKRVQGKIACILTRWAPISALFCLLMLTQATHHQVKIEHQSQHPEFIVERAMSDERADGHRGTNLVADKTKSSQLRFKVP